MVSRIPDFNKQFYLSSNKQQLLLMPLSVSGKISSAELIKIIEYSEFGDLKINKKGIDEAIRFYDNLLAAPETEIDVQPIMIAERLDAQLTITTDSKNMQATAKIVSAYGGKHINLDDMIEGLKQAKVIQGILKKTLHLLIKKSKICKPGQTYQAIIAKGKEPIHGKNAELKRLVETPNERIMKPKDNGDGTVDMRDLGELITVNPGTPLMRKIPLQEGTPGLTITGSEIKYKPAADVQIKPGENTEIDAEDEHLLIATIAGVPQNTDNGMMVDDSLIVKDVDVGFGNINYDGSIIITGNVCDGMEVKATGNISIAGFVESAYIECGGDLAVAKGIIGRKRTSDDHPFSCEIHCEGLVEAGFSQYAEMHIGKHLHVKNQLLHCMVLCQGHIKVENEKGNKGVILGGLLAPGEGISTVMLGAPAGTDTVIDLIGIYPELMLAKKQIANKIQDENQHLHSVFKSQQKIAAMPNSEKKEKLKTRFIELEKEYSATLEALKIEQRDNLISLEAYFKQSRVSVSNTLFSQIKILIANEVLLTMRDYGPSVVRVKEHEIIIDPRNKA